MVNIRRILFGTIVTLSLGGTLTNVAAAERAKGQPKLVHDLLWVWGNPEMATAGKHTVASFASASPAKRAELLGVPNVIMAGQGLPNDDGQADALTHDVAAAPHLIWEIAADGSGGPPFVYTQRVAQVRTLVDKYQQIEGVLLDDMSTVAIDKGLKPEHIQQMRQALDGKYAAITVWGVVYTMSFHRPRIDEYVKEVDAIALATWHAKDIVDLEKHVAYCEQKYPGKPIMLCLYLYDYGGARRMPPDLLKQQCETALKLAHARRIQGIAFVTINDDPEAVSWTADWIRRVGNQKLGSPANRGVSGKGWSSPKPSALPQGNLGQRDQLLLTALAVDAERPAARLEIGDGSDWHFTSGPWTQAADGVVGPPNKRNLHSRAFCTAQSFGDLTAEFEFNGSYRELGSGGAGLVFRASDVNHFYAVYCPWGGQQLRAKHFWVSIVKADGDGYLRNLKSVYVPGVPSETDRWYKVRLEAKGPKMEVWVDGRYAMSITDDSYQAGAVGMIGYGWYLFQNINITGKKGTLGEWDKSVRVPVHSFTVGLDSQAMPSGCVAPNGDVLLAAGSKLVRSKDKGRTWGPPETLPDKLGSVNDYGNTLFCTAKGRLIVQLYRDRVAVKKPVSEIGIAESADNGVTWSDPFLAKVAEGWPDTPSTLVPYGPLLETENGTLLRFLLGGAKEPSKFTNVVTWGSVHCKAYAIHSADGGKSWSAPIELDQPAWSGAPRGAIIGSLDLTEATGVAIGNKVMAVVRPVYSQTMWQCWSGNAGATWDAAARATFPGYAQSMVRTKSGVIVVAHRYPHYSVNLSRDNGLNWDEGTIIDYPFWAMGRAIEVEPDVVFCTYMNAERNMPLLAQLVRVKANGIEPVKK
jgi:hypothetical protein